jgi:hypothetical protein
MAADTCRLGSNHSNVAPRCWAGGEHRCARDNPGGHQDRVIRRPAEGQRLTLTDDLAVLST